jgi:3-isopropylmalate/(R)-2-methylmalate dehydratase small subunit
VWAIENYGFRVVIAPSFADIFYNNCFKNGVLPIRLSEEQVEDLFRRAAQPGYKLTIDLNECRITDTQGLSLAIAVEPARRHNLLHGLDDIALTLAHADEIASYEQRRGMQPA